jgi:hypothetical protein
MSNLPDSISVTVQRYENDYLEVVYVGSTLDELHTAGVINAEALVSFQISRKRFYMAGLGNGHCQRQRLYRPDRWEIYWRTNPEAAERMKLPGLDDAAARMRAERDLNKQIYRPVGRFQRPVQWSCEGNVIVVNWARLAAEAYVATHCKS